MIAATSKFRSDTRSAPAEGLHIIYDNTWGSEENPKKHANSGKQYIPNLHHQERACWGRPEARWHSSSPPKSYKQWDNETILHGPTLKWYNSLQDDNLQDLDMVVCKMIVCKIQIWQFARFRYNSLQDDSLQDVMVQFARHRYGNLQGNNLQDMDMNAVQQKDPSHLDTLLSRPLWTMHEVHSRLL